MTTTGTGGKTTGLREARRNGAVGPRRLKIDLNVSKAFFLGGAGSGGTRKNINLFTNITNIFNTVIKNNPSGVMSSDNFGIVTSAVDPREVEIGLRFQF